MTGEAGRHDAPFAANRSLWDAWTRVHASGSFYDLEGFKADGVRIRLYEVELIGDVRGKSLLICSATSGSTRCPGRGSVPG